MTQTKTQQSNPQIFTIWSDEIEGRIDPHFYTFKKLKNSNLISIKEIAEVQGGYAFKSDEYKQEYGVSLIRIQNIKNSEIDFSKTVYINEKYLNRLEDFLLNDKDIVIAMTGATIGKIGRIYQEDLPAFLNQRVGRFLIDNKKINPDYLFYILQFDFFTDQIKKFSLGGAQPNISSDSIEQIQIPFPSLQIQNKIVSIMSKAYGEKKGKEIEAGEILNSIDDFVLKELKIKMPEIKKEMVFEVWSDKMKSRIDSEYYQKFYKTFFSEIEKSKFPKEPLGNVTKFIINGRTPAKEDYVDSGNGVPIIKAGTASGKMVNLKKLGYVKNNFQGKQTAKKGDIFILSAAHQAEYVGKNVSLLDQELEQETYFVGELVGIRANQEKCLSRYLFSFLSTQFIFILMNREKRGQTSHLYPADLKNLPIPIPPLNIQKKIAEKIKLYYFQSKKLKKEAKEVLENAKDEVEEMILG